MPSPKVRERHSTACAGRHNLLLTGLSETGTQSAQSRLRSASIFVIAILKRRAGVMLNCSQHGFHSYNRHTLTRYRAEARLISNDNYPRSYRGVI
jgi:hypothetical protein